ncbi:hypothetical protein [Microcystis phage Mel-JY34]
MDIQQANYNRGYRKGLRDALTAFLFIAFCGAVYMAITSGA